jgi:hypothetical protein
MTNTSSEPNARRLSSLFSWNKSREMTARTCFLDLDITSPGKANLGVATELTHFDDENAHLSYTSLRDLLPTSRPGSPVKQKRQSSGQNGVQTEEKISEDDDPSIIWGNGDRLPIKNRLVEQAARAYLLPVSPQKTPPDQFFARYWAKLTSTSTSSENLLASPPHGRVGCIHGCTHGCLSCLPTLIWVDLTRVVHALFSQLRPQSLISDHAHSKVIMSSSSLMSPSLMTPSLVK